MAIRPRIRSGAARGAVVAAVASAAVGWSGDAGAFDVKKSASGQDLHWTESSLVYHLDSSVADATDGATAAIGVAASTWSGLQGAPAMSVVAGGGGASPGFDGLNTVFFAPAGSTLTGGALAVTVLTYDDNGHVLDADIVIDGRYRFAVLPASAISPSGAQPVSNEGALLAPSSAPFDLQHVVAHELGHSLGLADETADTSALMFLYSAPGAASPRAPASDDTAGIASLYDTGSSTGGAGCGGAAISPRTPTHAASRAALVFALALVVWVVARRRRGAGARPLAFAALALATFAFLPAERSARPAPEPTTRSSAHARVTHVETRTDASGLFTTSATLETTLCRTSGCPREATVTAYGGTIGGVHQEVVGTPATREGDEVEVTFEETNHAARIVAR